MVGGTSDRIALAVGPLEISWYGLCATIALAAAYTISYALWKRSNDSTGSTRDFDRTVLIVLVAGVIGARVLFVIYHLDYFLNAPSEVFALWRGGWVWHGGLIAGVTALFFAAKRNAQRFFRVADILAPALALAQGIGRWGNYFNQEAYGLPTRVWWAIPIDPSNRVLGFETATTFHPTFLYESVADLLLFAVLLVLSLRKNALAPGVIVALYLVIYSTIRFGIEFLRIDAVPVFFGLRTPQLVSVFLAIGAGAMLLRLAKREHS